MVNRVSKAFSHAAGALSMFLAGVAQATDVGTPLTPEISVAQESSYPFQLSAAQDAEGNFAVVWPASSSTVDSSGKTAAFSYRRIAADGTPLTSVVPVGFTASVYRQSGIAMDAAGDFVLAWGCYDIHASPPSAATVCAQVFNPDGTAKTGQIQVATQVFPTGLYAIEDAGFNSLAVAMNAAGDFVVAMTFIADYQKLLETHIQYVQTRRFHLDGTPYGDPRQLAYQKGLGWTTTFKDVNISMSSSGDYMVTWQSRQSGNFAKAEFFSADGTASSKVTSLPLRVQKATTQTYSTTLANNGDVLIALAAAPSNGSTATATLYLKRCSNQCKKQHAAVAIGSRPTPSSSSGAVLSVAATPSGGAIVGWGNSATNALTAAVFDANNNLVGQPFALGADDVPSDRDQHLEILVNPNSDLIAVWGQIKARVFQGQQ